MPTISGAFCSLTLLATRVAIAFAQGTSQEPLLQDISRRSNDSLLWGPYRPNLYFGVRPRIPKSLATALLWTKVDDYVNAQQNFRYTCEQSEGMTGYGWDEYDIRHGGRQTIHDSGNTLDLTIDFVKVPGGSNGGSWGARIKGTPREDAAPDMKTSMIFHAIMEGFGSLEVRDINDEPGFKDTVTIAGQAPGLGEFTLEVTNGPKSNKHPRSKHPSYAEKPLDRTFVSSLRIPEEDLWQGKNIMFGNIKAGIEKYVQQYGNENPPPPAQVFTVIHEPGPGNAHFVQKVFQGPFEFDILFSSSSAPERMTSKSLTKEIKKASQQFSERWKEVLPLESPYNQPNYDEFGKAMFSNLLGGIGYFYGNSLVDRSYAEEYEEENEGFWEEAAEARSRAHVETEGPSELFTSIPSRPFFPRGFLWDEGYHLIPIAKWDIDLTLQIVSSWMKLMDEDGWIAREQILGPEARSKVPPEFQVQYPHFANPPTLFFIIDMFINELEGKESAVRDELRSTYLNNKELGLQYLRDIYPLLKRHYFWFRRTQSGDIKSYDRQAYSSKEGYRWRGRTPKLVLPSGLDDYPRAQPPHPGELHVDLISWMGMMTRSIRRIAEILDESDDAAEFSNYEDAILHNIDDLHWDEDAKVYCDATIDDYEEHVHVCHKGYISLFPFMTGLVPTDSPKLGPILDLIGDPEELWSLHGIRSLSKKDEFYGTDENYWRSPVWMNMNYMIVKNLVTVAQDQQSPWKERALDLYSRLRANLVDTVFEEWKRTGFAWEQYNPETGQGQRTQHFTGWTSLVVEIMRMPDLGNDASKKIVRDEL